MRSPQTHHLYLIDPGIQPGNGDCEAKQRWFAPPGSPRKILFPVELMHDALKAFFLVFSALFPIVDPLSASPIFLALTRSVPPTSRRELSRRVTLNSFALMAGSYFLGSHLLAFFGVSLPAVQVGGGLIVCAFGWNLLMEKDGEKNAIPEAVESDDIFRKVFYPLTLPLTIGPATISVSI